MTTESRGEIVPVVLFEMIEPHLALVTLNRPEKRNAVNGEMAAALEAVVKRTEDDPQVRAVILTSSQDKVFCAGADLAAVASGTGLNMETAHGGFAGFVFAARTKPWIAAVEGVAVAGGFEICLACDMIVASRNARFGLPEVKRGLMAGAGGVHRLPVRIPASIAYELIATGEPIDAERAYATGLLNRLVEPGEALAAARELAGRITPNAPLAVQHSLAVARVGTALPDGAARVLAAERMAMLRKTEDFREGPRAFVEKRDPIWTGR
ncbi:enoyl-CoA hydratase-related protein [Novosphingobium sp. PS1R-30]|uniref:Enoyl-CoA hydratase-related protein n=1 Tax=Novosphingobium anseongense TaxID=3133436 RepID=A0ABU8S159_9SPHN